MMNYRELYQATFQDGDAFTDHFLFDRGAFPVTLEENGDTVAMCMVAPRELNPSASKLFGYRKAPAAMIGAVCVREDKRGFGYGKALMRKAIDVCRDLGFFAVYLSPDKGKASFYEQFGFETILCAQDFKTRVSHTPHFLAERATDFRRDLYRLVSVVDHAARGKASFAYGERDVARLIREGDTGDGVYFIRGRVGVIGFAAKDGDTIPWFLFAGSGQDGFKLSATVYEGKFLFQGCQCKIPAETGEPYMMRLCLKPKKPDAYDRPAVLFERY